MIGSTIFVAGIYGTGKSTLCSALSERLHIPAFSAGDLISAVNGERYGANKAVADKDNNQVLLWENTKKFAGISCDKYREYYKGCKVAYAYRLGQVTRYEPPKELSEFNISSPPQSFIYLSGDQSDDEVFNEIP